MLVVHGPFRGYLQPGTCVPAGNVPENVGFGGFREEGEKWGIVFNTLPRSQPHESISQFTFHCLPHAFKGSTNSKLAWWISVVEGGIGRVRERH